MKILLIDDDESLLTVYSTAFKKEGFEVVTALSGQEGLTKAKEGASLILLDQVLPDISGNEILKTLKETQETKDIPVIILSNFSQEELVKDALGKGATDYVFKYQVELSDIVKKVKETIGEPQKEENVTNG
jgi:DNA-binding response OmpR family regulator